MEQTTNNRIRKKGKGRNTESFDPKTTLVRPEMRIIIGSKTQVYNKTLKHDDVVIVPEFICQEDNLLLYEQLLKEMKEIQEKNVKGSEWISWHEGCHTISKNPDLSPTYQKIITRICEYFGIEQKNIGTRFNWYRDEKDWKAFHHDSAAFNVDRAKKQNITVGISLGGTRELAFLHAKNKTKIYFPQPNGTLFSFGRDVNITWRHGINAIAEEKQRDIGRISIIVWGLASNVEEESESPNMINNTPENYKSKYNKHSKRL